MILLDENNILVTNSKYTDPCFIDKVQTPMIGLEQQVRAFEAPSSAMAFSL